ncbi:unnamed protein product [Protopolystoma xenopodis]|uniref:AN1-type domain-containing protein n=1 Tax=Protopolystoma xenopodis TaxID=117903 RepID=A0A448WEC3_9PLAT|nr:unnamed protein product [Protopolystoma xenopodis]
MNNETPEMENKSSAKNLCTAGCGFYGSVQFKDMCSKCYQERLNREKESNSQLVRQSSDSRSSGSQKSLPSTTGSHSSPSLFPTINLHASDTISTSVRPMMKRKADEIHSASCDDLSHSVPSEPPSSIAELRRAFTNPGTNRCVRCKKRVGLTGFTCRCDGLFCSLHRYSDQHDCTFDYRALGRAELSRDNPEVRCAKIRKL